MSNERACLLARNAVNVDDKPLRKESPWRSRRPAIGDVVRPISRYFGRPLMVALLLCAAGCEKEQAASKLVWYCGAGIRPPAAEVAEAFGRRHNVTVECDYAGSEMLLSRIQLSKIGDLYMPGDLHYVEQAKEAGLVARSETVCYFIPVILVQKGNPKQIHELSDLTRPGITVGLGDAKACAIGRKCVKLFEKNGISDADLEDNLQFRSLTVNELGDKVKLNALDAVIVWDAVAASFADSADIIPIPREKNVISTVAAAVLTSSEHPDLAGQFLDFVTSSTGQAIFAKHHYSLSLPD